MSRLTSGMDDVVEADHIRPFILVDLEFDSGTIYLWSGVSDLVWNSNTYLAVGDLLKISPTMESGDLSAKGMNITLDGLSDDLIQKARDENYQGRTATIRLGALTNDYTGITVVADPTIIFAGFMDVMSISIAGEYNTINLALENKLIMLERSKERRWTAEDQKIEYPDDKGFDFVADLQDKEIIWGRSAGGNFLSNADVASNGGQVESSSWRR